MISQFSEILLSHPARLSGHVWRPGGEFAAFERLERKPYRPSEPAPETRDRMSLFEGVTAAIGVLILLAAALVV